MIWDDSWLAALKSYVDVPEDRRGDSLQCHIQIPFSPAIAHGFCLSHAADVLCCSSCSLLKFILICTQSEQLSATCYTYGAKGLRGKFLSTYKMLSRSLWNTSRTPSWCYNELCLSQVPTPSWTWASKFIVCLLPKENRFFLPFRQLFQQNLSIRP